LRARRFRLGQPQLPRLLATGAEHGRGAETEQRQKSPAHRAAAGWLRRISARESVGHKKRSLAAAIAARTWSGAVPPKLLREATDRSIARTSTASPVMLGSIART
jgi:hypothetical protein